MIFIYIFFNVVSMWEDCLLICSLGLYCSMVMFLYQVIVIVFTFTFFLSKGVPHFQCILCLRFLFTRWQKTSGRESEVFWTLEVRIPMRPMVLLKKNFFFVIVFQLFTLVAQFPITLEIYLLYSL